MNLSGSAFYLLKFHLAIAILANACALTTNTSDCSLLYYACIRLESP